MKEDRTFKVKLNTQSQVIKTKLNKTSSTVEVKTDINTVPEDIYYDEIIYYDGGGVEGYGYD